MSVVTSNECRRVPLLEVLETCLKTVKLNTCCAKIYERQFIVENVQFNPALGAGQDLDFVLGVLEKCKSIHYCPLAVYQYNYSEATYIGRSVRYKRTLAWNYEKLYLRKKEMLSKFSVEKQAEIDQVMMESLVQTLFNFCSNLVVKKEFNAEIREKVSEVINKLSVSKKDFSTKGYLKYTLLLNNSPLIYPIAYARHLYLLMFRY